MNPAITLWSDATRRDFFATAGMLLLGSSTKGAENAFSSIPNPFRLRMHWYIFGPAWTRQECDRELRNMRDAHIGGVLIFPTYPIAVDDPARGIKNYPYLSDEFLDVFRFVVDRAKQLGLTVDIVLGTGWPYGGPGVTLAQSAQALRRQTIPVRADVPVGLAPLKPGDRRIAVFHVDGAAIKELAADSAIPHAPRGEIQVFTSGPTHMQVKRASLGAEGLVLNHYSQDALEAWLQVVGDKLLNAVPPGSVRSIFCDSLEVYRANWTQDLPEVFRAKRGYDLGPRLPALFDASHPDSRDLRCDFWRTLSDLAGERFVRPLTEWAHRRGVTTQVEAYGTPPVSLASYREVDTPVGEHYEWKEFSSSRWASSGGRLAGKPVILAEAWTWLGLPNRFGDSLEQLKLCSDLHFLSGINALYGLTYAYSPAELGSPGWVPYFGPAMNHTSPSWPYFSYLADYVSRASYVLQQGKPVADIAVYLPAEDCMADAPTDQLLLNWAVRDRLSSNGPPPEFSLKNALHFESNVVKTIITNGYSFDGIDAFTLPGTRMEGGRLRCGDGDYAAVVLPNLIGIDAESIRSIAEFAHVGGIVIATRRVPERAWGMWERDRNSAAVKEIVAALFGSATRGGDYRETSYGAGKVIFAPDDLGSLEKALGAVKPDIALRHASEHVSFVHRRASDRDYYFFANTSESVQELEGVFRVGPRTPELWSLKSGAAEPVAVFEPTPAGPRLRFTLGPLESRVYVFVDAPRAPAAYESDADIQVTADGWRLRAFENGAYRFRGRNGLRWIEVSGIPPPYHLKDQWQLRFDGADQPTIDGPLRSWTEIEGRRWFSGQGVYQAEFRLPSGMDAIGVDLDLGRVHETAQVAVNGKVAGVAWMRPYRMDISGFIQPGVNTLRVIVTNLLINRILGDGPPDYSAVYAKYGERFPAGDEWRVIREPFTSGLLGPVRLVFHRMVPVA